MRRLKPGKPSDAKKVVKDSLGYSLDVMKKAWQRLRADRRIKEAQTLGRATGPNWPKAQASQPRVLM